MSSNARSDNLELMHGVSRGPAKQLLPFLSQIIQTKIIINANIAYKDILWMAKKRENPEAQTETIEITRTGFAEIHAPEFIKEEVSKYIPEIAQKAKKPVEEIEALWREYSLNIHFHNTDHLPALTHQDTSRDPKDIPYLQLQQHLNHLIVSRDKDIAAMGGKTVDLVVISRLKDLYRANATEYQVALVGYGVVVFGYASIVSLISTLRAGLSKLFNLPEWAYPLIILALIIIYNNPRLREKFSLLIDGILAFIPQLTDEIIKHTNTALTEYREAQRKGMEIRKELPPKFNSNE